MSVILQSSSGGQITLQEPTTASNFTQTLPSASGTVMVSGNQPAFSAHGTANQTLSNGTFTKIAYNTEIFDTNSNYDPTTNFRFTPTVAGYYQINAVCAFGSAVSGAAILSLYKNGTEFIRASVFSLLGGPNINISNLVYANGTTDYFEIFGWQNSGGNLSCGTSSSTTPFSGCLLRAA
jgi:hypothetical protein